MKSYIAQQNRIQGIKDVSETVKMVEKIAASSVHFLKKEVSDLQSYTNRIEEVLSRLSLFYHKKQHPLLQKRTTGEKALVILTGDGGLVGDLWHNVINTFLAHKSNNFLAASIIFNIDLILIAVSISVSGMFGVIKSTFLISFFFKNKTALSSISLVPLLATITGSNINILVGGGEGIHCLL